MTYNTTRDLNTALAGGYIGEGIIRPNKMQNFIHWFFTKKQFPTFTFYYYGEPDKELKEIYGYDTSTSERKKRVRKVLKK